MPQFDFNHFPSQIFWLIICFTALLLSAREEVLFEVFAYRGVIELKLFTIEEIVEHICLTI